MLPYVREGITHKTQDEYLSVLSVILNQLKLSKKTSGIAFHSF